MLHLYYYYIMVVIVVVMNVYQFVSVWVELTDTRGTLHFTTVNSVLFLVCVKVISGKEQVNS